jgi:hypothetical protein
MRHCSIAGYEGGGDDRFGALHAYLANLRDAIIPLAIPIGAIGLVVGGGMYVVGNPTPAGSSRVSSPGWG